MARKPTPTPEQGEQELIDRIATVSRNAEELRAKVAAARDQETRLEHERRALLVAQALGRDPKASEELAASERTLLDLGHTIAGLSELRRATVDQVEVVERELRSYRLAHWQHFAARQAQTCDEWVRAAASVQEQVQAWADQWAAASRRHGELRAAGDPTSIKPQQGGSPVDDVLAAIAKALEQGPPRLQAAYIGRSQEPIWPKPAIDHSTPTIEQLV